MATQGKIRVYKREAKKGVTYTYSIEAGRDANGKRKRVTKSGFKTAREARAAAQPILNKLLLGENIIESNITFKEYAEQWRKEHCIGLKPYTKENITNIIIKANKYLGNKKIKDITLYDYQQFLNNCRKNLSKGTLKTIHGYVKLIFKQAVKYNIIRTNPALDAIIPKYPMPLINPSDLFLTKSELEILTSYAQNYNRKNSLYFYYMLMFLIYTGVRIGEACALLWQDVDFSKKCIHIKSSLFAKNNAKYLRQDTPKTKDSLREIIIDDYLLDILKEWKIKQLEIRLKNNTQNKRDTLDYVFTKYSPVKDKELPVLPSKVRYIFTTINNAKILNKRLHPHLIRHTHCSLLAEAGVPLAIIQERLGHSDDSTTKKIYLHITEKSKANAANIFSEYMQIK